MIIMMVISPDALVKEEDVYSTYMVRISFQAQGMDFFSFC